ncbi:hypothetical protein ABW19_dt0201315 [Dactylella cylindrospora]|nr:hypothetical protein ABW19_dt0201315 [Dactylella cylindrospora]
MIEGPYSTLNLSCDGRFMHLSSSFISNSSSSSSSSSSPSSPPSPSSTSPSSFADSPSTLSKSSIIPDHQTCSTTSSKFSFYPSPCTVNSGLSSVTSVDLASPYNTNTFSSEWNDDSYNFSAKPSWPSATHGVVASKHASNLQRQACLVQPLPKEQLQNPRRTKRLIETPGSSSEPQIFPLPPPSLVRQADRKVNFVDNLVDTAAQIVEAIWPSMAYKSCEPSQGRVLPLRTFIQETLRRSRTSYSTLQVALYYLFVIRPYVPADEDAASGQDKYQDTRALQCGRRMFLAALILASKYLQDRNYSARAWSKISGLNINEINANELAFLTAVNWRLHISDCIFDKWTKIVLKCTPTTSIIPANQSPAQNRYPANKWIHIFSQLDTTLDVSALDAVLNEVDRSTPCTIERRPSISASEPEYSATVATGRGVLGSPAKKNSMAFALATPCGGQSMCIENTPSRCAQMVDERNANRAIRKSSLSMCETVDTCEREAAIFDARVPLRNTSKSNLHVYVPAKPAVVVDAKQRVPSNKTFSALDTPAREQVLGESRRLNSTYTALSVQENSGKTRKRGNETPVAARNQKKQKEKLGEFAAQKPQEVVPSGLTPQMKQMNTNFSLSGKKGNGLRMNINPGFALSGNHSQTVRPGTGQRSMSHVVYG